MSSLTSVAIADSVIQLSDTIKILGVTLDSSLTMGPHTKALSKSCFYHLRFFKQIMDYPMAVSVASALISSRLDYANSVLVSCPQKHIARLQRAQHALRVVTQRSTRFSPLTSTNLLEQLHWLPIEWQIRFKLASSTYKAIHTDNPPYLADLLQHHKSIRFIRSSSSYLGLLDVPRHNLSLGSRAFRVSALQVYDSLPLYICQAQTLTSFRHHLETYYFQSAYPVP